MPYSFGVNEEFLASPRIDNLTSVYASLEALLTDDERNGICVAACLDNEEVGSSTPEGADGDFLQKILRRVAYALHFDEEEYCKALACSYLLSLDNAHAAHPNHPEKCDPTNRPCMGSGVLIKAHACGAYITEALSAAVLKTIFEKANVPHAYFYNRSDVASGSTLAGMAVRYVSIPGADIGIPQLAMHSACECIAYTDYEALENGLNAYYSAVISINGDDVVIG
jgi:aspartyl aminopeptidase